MAADLRRGAAPQGVALATPYGHALVERTTLGGLQFGRAEEVRDPARHVDDDPQLRSRGPLVGGGVLGQEVGDGGTDGTAADVVVAGRAAMDWPPRYAARTAAAFAAVPTGRRPPLITLVFGGPQSVVRQLPLTVALEFAGGGEGLHHELHGGQQLAGTRVAGGEVH
ncbi:hypothetical protein AB0B40_36280 [Streptomyces sp. NPDC042638]|uniref:hypothetical protein n=1 Tax=Streptomyces sp. NPDC042638 TaxID=3154333 RepID=UPI0033FA93E0